MTKEELIPATLTVRKKEKELEQSQKASVFDYDTGRVYPYDSWPEEDLYLESRIEDLERRLTYLEERLRLGLYRV